MLAFLIAVSSQNASPSPTQQNSVSRPPNQESQRTQEQTNGEHRGSEQSPLVIKILPAENRQNESAASAEQRPSNPNEMWSLSDRIAVIATIVGALQFGALVATVWVLIFNGRRQLRAYVLPENMGIFDGTTVNPPQPQRAGIPGVAMLIKNSGQTPAYRVVSGCISP